MKTTIHRLTIGNENLLRSLAEEDADFDVEGRGGRLKPLGFKAAKKFLADPSVLFWTAEEKGRVVGFLFCYLLKMRAGEDEVLLYEIGVRKKHRRTGVGKALQSGLEAWMGAKHLSEAWVLADNPGAEAFYKSCGFKKPKEMAVYMTKTIQPTRKG